MDTSNGTENEKDGLRPASIDSDNWPGRRVQRDRLGLRDGDGDDMGIRLDEETLDAIRSEGDAHLGVKKVEAAQKVYGRKSKWLLYLGLALASYMYSLDGSTTFTYLSFATSSFGDHTFISSVQVAQSIIIAVGKPVIAKIADVSSRATAYCFVLLCYVLGYIVIASAQNVQTIAGGIIIYAVGYTGLQLLTQIIIADITTLKWRGLVSNLTTAPFIVNGFIGANISSAILKRSGWRWGYGMFAILVPISLAPLIITLLWAERKAKLLGLVPTPPSSDPDSGTPLTPLDPHPPSSTHAHGHAQGEVNINANGTMNGAPLDYGSTNASPTKQSFSPSPPPAAAAVPGGKKTKTRTKTILSRVWKISEQLDVLGLMLLGGGVACILLPLTLAEAAKGGWRNPSMISMLIIGFVLTTTFCIYEVLFAKRPVITPRFWANKAVVAACTIGFFDFVSYYLTYTYLYSFIVVTKDWTLVDVNYFSNTQTVALTIFGILGGVIMRLSHRYKYLLITGLVIRLAGVGLMIHSRGADGSTAELVWTQILQGIGGGIASATSQVGAQASVTHGDVAITTALVLLITEIGGSVGGAIAGAIWSNTMPHQLDIHLPFLNATERAEIYGSITIAADQPLDSPTRQGVIAAYSETMKVMLIAATALSIIPPLVANLMPNYYLGDQQNAVDQADLTGGRPGDVEHE